MDCPSCPKCKRYNALIWRLVDGVGQSQCRDCGHIVPDPPATEYELSPPGSWAFTPEFKLEAVRPGRSFRIMFLKDMTNEKLLERRGAIIQILDGNSWEDFMTVREDEFHILQRQRPEIPQL